MRERVPTERRAAPVPRELRAAVLAAVADWRRDHAATADPVARRLADLVEDRRLHVAYQPVVQLATSRPVAVEALVRLDDPPDPALVGAAGLVGVAERAGLIQALGIDVLVRACAQLATWRRHPELGDLRLHVNVSALQLRSDALLDVVTRTLAATRLPADRLVLEVTETAAFEHVDHEHGRLHSLANLGVGVALDDFGTGFATLELLASGPFTMLKLDRGFVDAVGAGAGPVRGRGKVVQAAVGLGVALGLDVVAEGIERREQVMVLREWGCELGQGYLFARPSDEAAVRAWAAATTPIATTADRSRLGPRALDLAAAAALVVTAGDPRAGSLRADAVEASRIVGSALGLPRARTDVVALLATLVGSSELLEVLRTVHAIPAWQELDASLAQLPRLDADAHAGAIAGAIARLAVGRRVGSSLDDVLTELLPDGGTTRDVLRERLDAWWHQTTTSPAPLPAVREYEARVRGRDDAAERLRGLVGVARSIGSDGDLLDVLEVAAEAALSALGAASVSVSRWDRESAALQTVVNVGHLAPPERRRPSDERYALHDLPASSRLLLDRALLLVSVEDPTTDPAERNLLIGMGKGSAAAAPIIVEGAVWGELYATTALHEPAFGASDLQYASAVAGFIGLAIARAEHLGDLARLAGEDPLTRLANRRRMEEYAAVLLRTATADEPVIAVMLDVNGLKEVNDVYGHAAGDELLIAVGQVLSRVAMTHGEALAARLGGDEFCLVAAGGPADALALVERISGLLAATPTRAPQVSVGVAVAGPDDATLRSLLARADAAQYRAKATGVVAVFDDGEAHLTPSRLHRDPDDSPVRPRADRPGRSVDAAVGRWSRGLTERDAEPRLQRLGEVVLHLCDLNCWTLSSAPPGSSMLATHDAHLRRRRPHEPMTPPSEDPEFDITDYPATAEAFERGGGFAVDADDPGADPHERALLTDDGFRYVVAVTETAPDGRRWLLECYGDEASRPMQEVMPIVEALASRTLGRRVRCRT